MKSAVAVSKGTMRCATSADGIIPVTRSSPTVTTGFAGNAPRSNVLDEILEMSALPMSSFFDPFMFGGHGECLLV